jgi:hypothetical protein
MKKLILVYLSIAVFLALSGCDSNPWMEQLLEPKTITFDISGGSPVPSQTVYRGQKIVEPQPTMDGWEFDGWYTDKESVVGENTWDFDTIPEGDMTLYGFWTNGTERYKPIAFASSFMTVTYGDPPVGDFTIVEGNHGEGEVTYESSNTDVAMVGVNDGKVTIIKVGTIVVTATILKDGIYPASSASYTLIVEPKEIKFNVPANFTLIPFDSDESTTGTGADTTCGTTISVTAIQSDVVNGDSITITLASNSYGLSLKGNTTIDSTSTLPPSITLEYNGTATVVNPKVTVPLTSSNPNYTIAPIDVTILDGRTSDRPIPVKQENIKRFNEYANTVGLSRHYEQVEDPISLSSNTTPPAGTTDYWTAIGTKEAPFTGSFDGGGYTITNLTVNNSSAHNQGMFGFTSGNAVIRNIKLVNCNITGNGQTGCLVGTNGGTVENCSVTGSDNKVNGDTSSGGVVGSNAGMVRNCYATVDVTSSFTWVGGVVGQNNGTVEYCYATGAVSGSNLVGGVVGGNTGTVRNCVALNTGLTVHHTSDQNPDEYGRVVGQQNTGTLVNNYGKSNMTGPDAASLPNWASDKNGKDGESVRYNNNQPSTDPEVSEIWWQMEANWVGGAWDFSTIWTWSNNTLSPTLR